MKSLKKNSIPFLSLVAMSARTRVCKLFGIVCLLGIGLAQADPAPLVQDTYVDGRGKNATKNLGGKKEIKIDPTKPNDAFVQFDTSGFGGTVLTAELTFNVVKVDADGTVDLHFVLEGWNEFVMIYATQPTVDSFVQASVPVTKALEGGTVTVDVTATVQAWVDNPFTNFGLELVTSDASVKFGTKESGNEATLDVVTDGGEPPPPAPQMGSEITITSVFVDFDNYVLLIDGENFDNGKAPVVSLGTIGVLSQPVAASATSISADFPAALLDGDHLLSIETGLASGQQTTYDLTIDALASVLSVDLDQEIADRIADVDAEVLDRADGDTALQSNIDNETTARIAEVSAAQWTADTAAADASAPLTNAAIAQSEAQNAQVIADATSADLATETSERIDADARLQAIIDRTGFSDYTRIVSQTYPYGSIGACAGCAAQINVNCPSGGFVLGGGGELLYNSGVPRCSGFRGTCGVAIVSSYPSTNTQWTTRFECVDVSASCANVRVRTWAVCLTRP